MTTEGLSFPGDLLHAWSANLPTAVASSATLLTLVYIAFSLLLRRSDPPAAAAKADAEEQADGNLPSPEQALALIKARRTVHPQDFSGEPVPRHVVEACLEAANWAPTHGRTEPWRFVVMERGEWARLIQTTLEGRCTRADVACSLGRRKRLLWILLKRGKVAAQTAKGTMAPASYEAKKAKLEKKLHKEYQMASHLICICQKRFAKPEKPMPEWEERAATCCAVENLWLAATALGAAGYWSSWTREACESAGFKAYLGLAPEDACLGVFFLGMAKPGHTPRQSRGPIAAKVEWRG